MLHQRSVTHIPLLSAKKAAHSGFETQRRRHQKSKTGVSVAPIKKTCALKKNFFKKVDEKLTATKLSGHLPLDQFTLFEMGFFSMVLVAAQCEQ